MQSEEKERFFILTTKRNEEPTVSMQNESTTSVENSQDDLNFFSIIHMKCLLSFMKQFLCSECKCSWDGSVSVKERNGLYMHFEFVSFICASVTRFCTLSQMPKSRRHEINV